MMLARTLTEWNVQVIVDKFGSISNEDMYPGWLFPLSVVRQVESSYVMTVDTQSRRRCSCSEDAQFGNTLHL